MSYNFFSYDWYLPRYKPPTSVTVGSGRAGPGRVEFFYHLNIIFRWKQTLFLLCTICQKCLVFEIPLVLNPIHWTGALSLSRSEVRSASSPRFARLRSQLLFIHAFEYIAFIGSVVFLTCGGSKNGMMEGMRAMNATLWMISYDRHHPFFGDHRARKDTAPLPFDMGYRRPQHGFALPPYTCAC